MTAKVEHPIDGIHGPVAASLPKRGDAPGPLGCGLTGRFPDVLPVEFKDGARLGMNHSQLVLVLQAALPLTRTQWKPVGIHAPTDVL